MSGETVITIVGNLTADPELRWTQSGSPVASFTIASTPRFFDRQSGEWKDRETLFMRCTAWREMAENIAESLRKGMRTVVRGRLVQRSFETREGDRRTVVELQADEVGVSLRHARAQVTRTGGQGQQGQPAAGSAFATAPAPVGQESSTGSDPWAEAMLPSDPPF